MVAGGIGTQNCRQLAQADRRVIALNLASREERVTAFHSETAGFGEPSRSIRSTSATLTAASNGSNASSNGTAASTSW